MTNRKKERKLKYSDMGLKFAQNKYRITLRKDILCYDDIWKQYSLITRLEKGGRGQKRYQFFDRTYITCTNS